MTQKKSSERGQALVLIVLAIIAVLGFSALAIDGGMLYAERRRAQNAADTAVFAAAMAGIDGGDWHTAGMNQALMNDFDHNDEDADVYVFHPPQTGIYAGKLDYYQVKIRTEFSPFFAQFVYSGKLENTVEAVAKAKPSTVISPGNAIHATADSQCHAVWFSGSSSTLITDANIYSNSTANSNGCEAGIKQGSGYLTLQNGTIVSVGDFEDNGHVNLDPGKTINDNSLSNRLDVPLVTPPVCDGMPVRNMADFITSTSHGKSTYDLPPGIYPGGINAGNDIVNLARGIYCLDDDFEVGANGEMNGMLGVLIYMRGSTTNPNPAVKLDGGGDVRLASATGTALYDNASPPKDWSGMVIYMRQENGAGIDISGGAGSSLWGTIYAPGPRTTSNGAKTSKCDIQGNASSFNFRAQLVCYTVGITGNATLEVHFREEEQFHEPPMVELSQ